MLASLLRIGLKVRSKSSDFLKQCREQNFAFGLRFWFILKRQCRLFLFRCHNPNIYKYAYLCNFSHKWSNFGFFRGFLSRNCEFYANLRIKCAYFRFILGKIRACLSFLLCNCIAIAFQLLCNCNANYASLSCLVNSPLVLSSLRISIYGILPVIRVFLSLCSFLSFVE